MQWVLSLSDVYIWFYKQHNYSHKLEYKLHIQELNTLPCHETAWGKWHAPSGIHKPITSPQRISYDGLQDTFQTFKAQHANVTNKNHRTKSMVCVRACVWKAITNSYSHDPFPALIIFPVTEWTFPGSVLHQQLETFIKVPFGNSVEGKRKRKN